MKYLALFFSITFSLLTNNSLAQETKQPTPIKLYAMDCGRIDVSNFAAFSDTNDYDNQSMQLADPCFLIIHPKGTLLWDTGLSDTLIKKPETVGVYHLTKSVSLQDNLKKIGMKTSDIQYVSVSHSHFDHMSMLDQFPHATWILQEKELSYAKTHPNPFVIDASSLKSWKTAHKTLINGDYDVFGDGTVEILNMPGHTPGHQSLKVTLPQTGIVILSGDEFHQRASFESLLVPTFNTSRAETMASANRINGLIKNLHARLVIQHDLKDFEAFPVFPNYLD